MFSCNLKKLRLSHGFNQVELAKNLSVTKQTISNWENDNIQPSVDMMIKIAAFFNVSVDFLLGLDSRRVIDVTGLNDRQVAHINLIVQDLKSANK